MLERFAPEGKRKEEISRLWGRPLISVFLSALFRQAVSFVLQRDRKTKRIVAADLEVTNDPIETEVFIEQQLQGMIVYLPGNAPQNNAPAAASGSEFGRPPPRSAGRIDFKYEGEVFHASFDSTGIHVDSVRWRGME